MKSYSSEEKCRIMLQNAQHLSWKSREALMMYFGSAEIIFDQMGPSVQKMAGDKAFSELTRMKSDGFASLEEKLKNAEADVIFRGREDYPLLLNEINDSPHALFIRGKGGKDEKSVAIVGSRRDTRYGRTQAFKIAKELAQAGITVVSGLARGIDTAAHQGALAGDGRTIAVLGNGIDRVYPDENRDLAIKIVDSGGAVYSEFPLGTEPIGRNFPTRNRIISGISSALLLIEGDEHSGSMITATYAAEQSREVFALPGMVDVPGSIAPHRLLREGAHFCTCARDILEDMGWLEKEETPVPQKEALPGLSMLQQKIYDCLLKEEKSFEELTESTGIPPEDLSVELTMMEMDNIIEPRAGRTYALKN